MDKIKVLVIPTWYPNGKDKLMGCYHVDFANGISEVEGVQVDMLYVFRQLFSKPLTYLKQSKLSIIQEKGFKLYQRLQYNLRPLGFNLQMKSYLRSLRLAYAAYEKENGKPDIIHAMVCCPAGYAAVRLAKEIDVPVVITEHTLFHGIDDAEEKDYVRYAIKGAKKVTAVSDFVAGICREHGFECGVLPNSVDTTTFDVPLKDRTMENGEPDDTIRIATVCALRSGKGLDDIMRACNIIREKGRKIHYTLIGDGEYEEFYRNAWHETGTEDIVEFVGRKTHEETAEILSGCDMLVIASDIETFGIPALEAMATGIPVVCSHCRGPEEYITEETGVFCDYGKPESIAEAILTIADNRSRYTEEACRKRADDYSTRNISEKTVKMYREILGR